MGVLSIHCVIMGWCSVGVDVGIKSWHDRLASRIDSKHNLERRSLDRHQTPVEDNTPLNDLACNTRKEIEVFEGSRFHRALCLCAMAPALVGRAKRGGCLRRVCLEFLRFGASLAREPILQYRRFEIGTLG